VRQQRHAANDARAARLVLERKGWRVGPWDFLFLTNFWIAQKVSKFEKE
jgi:hypothetical protein